MNKKLLSLVMSGMVLTSSNFSLEAKAVDKLKSARNTAVEFVKNHKKLVIGTVIGAIAAPIATFAAVKAVKKIISIDWNKNDKKSNNIQSLKSKILESLSKDEIVKIDSLSVVEARELKAELESSGIKVDCNIPNLPNNAKGTLIVKNDSKKEVGAPRKVIMEFEILSLKDKSESKEQPVENEKSEGTSVEEKAEVQEGHKDDKTQEKAVEKAEEVKEAPVEEKAEEIGGTDLAELFKEETVEKAPAEAQEETVEEDIIDPLGSMTEEETVEEDIIDPLGSMTEEETAEEAQEETRYEVKPNNFLTGLIGKVFEVFNPYSTAHLHNEPVLNSAKDLKIKKELWRETMKVEEPFKSIGIEMNELGKFENVKDDTKSDNGCCVM